ncbi:MAG: tRNA lysidine(34) synthetase TilS [Lachnoclostridium sp.]|nr:tRNA lysidine(34) synthetase TilS [Lachnoclostridium sp.]
MKDFESKIKDFICDNNLVAEDDTVLVTLSGGADSVALARVLARLGITIVAAHCNFHLRGDESDRDESFVRDFCRDHGIELHVKHFDVTARCLEYHESVETACRNLRYDWFENLRREIGAKSIAVAHHADDNVETFLFNAMRGTSVKGLKGMLPRNGYIIRPFLEVTRHEIIDYLTVEGLDHVEDSTNASTDYARNRIRNLILPEMERSFSGASTRIALTQRNLRDDYLLLSDYVAELTSRFVASDGSIAVRDIIKSHPHPVQALYQLVKDHSITFSQVEDIIESQSNVAQSSGLCYNNYTLSHGILHPIKETSPEVITITPGNKPLLMRLFDRAEFSPSRCPDRAWFDSSILDGDPVFQIRGWEIADRFRPFGMKGSKKLSDLFASHHFNLNDKTNARVLTRNGEIIWVIGLRQSALFPVTDRTKQYVEFQWIE